MVPKKKFPLFWGKAEYAKSLIRQNAAPVNIIIKIKFILKLIDVFFYRNP